MKTNVVKILALLAMAVSMGACTGQQGRSSEGSSGGQDTSSQSESESESETQSEESSSEEPSSEEIEDVGVVGIGEILDLDANNQWTLLGKKMTIENLVVQGKYGNTIIGGTAVGQYISDLRGLQIDCAEFPTFEVGSGWGADITATGILADVNGRAVLTEAEVTVNSERVYNEARTSYEGGLPVYMFPAEYNDRSTWDQLMGRNMSGIYLGGTYQLAEVPETITPETETLFYCAYPGEYLDVDDPDNYSIITLNVPAGLSQAACDAFNTYFADKEVGDFFCFEGTGQYDAIDNLGYGLLVDSWAAQSFTDPEEDPVIYTKWEDVAEKVNPAYQDPLPDLGDDEKVFTYTFQVYEGRAISQLFNDLTYVYITDKDNCLFTDLFFYAKPSEMDDTFASVCGKAEAAGYTAVVEEAGASIYTLKDAGENVISQIDVFESDAYIEVYYFGIPFSTDFEDFAGVKALYEKRAGKLVAGFESALVDTAVAGENYHLDYADETYFYDKYKDEIYIYDFEITFAAAQEGADEAYYNALLAAGFEAMRLDDYMIDGLFNEDSGEFVDPSDIKLDEEKKVLSFEVFVLSEDAIDDYIVEIPTPVDLETAMAEFDTTARADIEAITGAASTYSNSIGAVLEGNEYAENYEFNGSYGRNYAKYYASYGLITQYLLTIHLVDGVGYAAAGAQLIADLETAGFEEANFALFEADGLFNATTNEFVIVQAMDASTLMVQILVLDATSAAFVGPVEAGE